MAYSPLRKRKHHKREPQSASLNLTSMMDIFTILLLFLLKSFSAEGNIVTVPDNLQLPVSTSQQKPKQTVNILVTTDSIIIEGKEVAKVDEYIIAENLLIPSLQKELNLFAQRTKNIAAINKSLEFRGDITIQADKSIPFRLLKKIMYTCGQSEFSNISLAVFSDD